MKSQAEREQAWREISSQLQSGSPDANVRLLVLAAHPDDETIGASVLLSRFPQSSVAFLTDGAPRDTRLWPPGLSCTREEYATVRRQEAIQALSLAGVSQEQIFWLGGVDQEAAFEISILAERFTKLLADVRATVVVTHPYEGGHPDHDTAALVARIAVSLCENGYQPALVEMPSYHARDGRCVTGEFLDTHDLSPQLCFEFSSRDRERKRRMMDSYASQALVLESFSIDRELLRIAPDYDFAQPPHQGKLWYECMGWQMAGARWRALAIVALAEFQEHSCR